MHPVESTLYYSAALIPVMFGTHPAIPLGCLVDYGCVLEIRGPWKYKLAGFKNTVLRNVTLHGVQATSR